MDEPSNLIKFPLKIACDLDVKPVPKELSEITSRVATLVVGTRHIAEQINLLDDTTDLKVQLISHVKQIVRATSAMYLAIAQALGGDPALIERIQSTIDDIDRI